MQQELNLLHIELVAVVMDLQNSECHLLWLTTNHCLDNKTHKLYCASLHHFISFLPPCCSAARKRDIIWTMVNRKLVLLVVSTYHYLIGMSLWSFHKHHEKYKVKNTMTLYFNYFTSSFQVIRVLNLLTLHPKEIN